MAVMFASMSVSGQESVGTFSLIPKIGVSIANISGQRIYFMGISGDTSVKGKYNARSLGGLEAEYQAFPTTSFSLGAFYVQQGCRYPDIEVGERRQGTDALSRMRVKMDYLQVPLMVNHYLVEGLAVKAGVQLGFLLKSGFSYEDMPITYHDDGTREYGERVDYDEDDKKMRRTVAVSIPVGVSYEYANVVIDARYHFGLTKLYKDDEMPSEKHKVFTLTVGYKFNL